MLIGRHVEESRVVNGDDLELQPFLLGLKLPRHDVGVVLDGRNHDFIALAHERVAKRAGHEVDSLGGATGKHHLCGGARIEETAHRLSRLLMQVGGLLAHPVHPAMHIGIDVEVFLTHGIEHTQRLLCGGRVVEIHQRLAIDRAGEYGKV